MPTLQQDLRKAIKQTGCTDKPTIHAVCEDVQLAYERDGYVKLTRTELSRIQHGLVGGAWVVRFNQELEKLKGANKGLIAGSKVKKAVEVCRVAAARAAQW